MIGNLSSKGGSQIRTVPSIAAAFLELDRRAYDGDPRYADSEIPRRAENLWRQQNGTSA